MKIDESASQRDRTARAKEQADRETCRGDSRCSEVTVCVGRIVPQVPRREQGGS